MNKVENVLNFYLLTSTLKDKVRSGWKIWNIERERVESVAEHIYGTCMLAIAIDSEYKMNIDLQKTILMITLHEVEEIQIGDLTPFDNITQEEKRKIGKKAVEYVFDGLIKKQEYIDLIEEFEIMETRESIFAKMCDKLEADIQSKLYCEEGVLDINNINNTHLLDDIRIKKLISEGAKSIADLFIENDRPLYKEDEFIEILDYIKENEISKLKKGEN